MKPPSINSELKGAYKDKIRKLKKEYDELISVMMTQPGAPTREQVSRKNYLETELHILETNKQ